MIDLQTIMLKKALLLLLISLSFVSFSFGAETKGRDTLFIDSLNSRFASAEDPVLKSSIIDFYIDSIGVKSNDFLKFITLVATKYDFTKEQKERIFQISSALPKDTRIITYFNFFKDRSYIPVLKQWYAKSDKRAKFLYESTLYEYDDKEIKDQWANALRGCSKANKTVSSLIGQLFPIICSHFPDRKFCDIVLDFLIEHQNQYFVIRDMSGVREYNDVVYFLSFFLVDRLKGFPDAFIFNKFERSSSNGDERYVSFSKADKEIIVKWCRAHRRDYEFAD